MRLLRPDPNAETAKDARRRFTRAMRVAMGFVAVLWMILLLDVWLDLELRALGTRPGVWEGLVGLLTMPLIHGGFAHLLHNTLPALTLGAALLYFYPTVAARVIGLFWTLPGLWVWFTGEPESTHFGASGLNFALLGFLALSGILRAEATSLGLSLGVLFLYGSMFSGILPLERGISWESHLGGLIVGLICAIIFRKRDVPPPRRYSWEDEEEDDEDFLDATDVPPPDEPHKETIH